MCTEPRNLWKSLWPNDNRCGTLNIARLHPDRMALKISDTKTGSISRIFRMYPIRLKTQIISKLPSFLGTLSTLQIFVNECSVKVGPKISSGPSNCRESARRSRTKSMPWAERCAGPCFGRDSPTKYCFVLCGVGWWRHSQYIPSGELT